MLDLLRWYIVLQVVGLAALPLCARAFRGLPDRGFAFARPVGLLAVGSALWMGALYGLWPNRGATVALLTLALGLIGWIGLRPSVAELRRLWCEHRTHLLLVEALFLVALLFWVLCRSQFPNIEATEKPMEFGFLNGILRSTWFPPADPWLAGHSISYYYLGYVLIAALIEFSGVLPAVGFNLAIATLFACTVTGAFALGHALIDGRRRAPGVRGIDDSGPLVPYRPSWIGGGLAALFVGLFGNLEGFLELLHSHGIGSAAFWESLAVWQLNQPYQSPFWYPNEAQDNWWWFRASRVILDYPPGAPPPEGYNTINEFPFFSFLLGDLHPHLLALPYAFVALAFTLSFLRTPGEFRLSAWFQHRFEIGFITFFYGALFLLNAWDILTYLFVLCLAFAARRYLARPRFNRAWFVATASFGVTALLSGVLLYWPFYVTFQSQATGLLGIVRDHSHLRYFLLYWGPFIFLTGSFLAAELLLKKSASRGPAWARSPLTVVVVAVLAIGAVIAHAPALAVLIPMLVASLALAVRSLAGAAAPGAITPVSPGAGAQPLAPGFSERLMVLLLIFTAVLLLTGTELVYLKDAFDNRMNTVFKLYFQSWGMLALASAYAVYDWGSPIFEGLSKASRRLGDGRPRRWIAAIWFLPAGALILAAFVYVPMALASRSNGFSNPFILDGLHYYQESMPDDAAAIAWLAKQDPGTPAILEASGGSYSAYANVAWMSGLPTVLGWEFHEIQWHGASILPVVDERKRDIATIYTTTDRRVAQDLLRKYQVVYVYVGPREREAFGQNPTTLTKFSQFMDTIYRNPAVTIYRTRGGGS